MSGDDDTIDALILQQVIEHAAHPPCPSSNRSPFFGTATGRPGGKERVRAVAESVDVGDDVAVVEGHQLEPAGGDRLDGKTMRHDAAL